MTPVRTWRKCVQLLSYPCVRVFELAAIVGGVIYFGDRVVASSARSACVRLNLLVDLPRPCEVSIITSAEFVEYERVLVATLNKGPLAQTALRASAKLQCHKMLRPENFNVETSIGPEIEWIKTLAKIGSEYRQHHLREAS